MGDQQKNNPNEKLSSGDICLKKNSTMLDISKNELLQIDDDLYQINIKLEHRAWECPFCGESQEYYMVNGSVIIGLGGHTQSSNGKRSNSCCDCMQKADDWHKET